MKYSFLLCSERSGSNLLTKILDAHPRILGPTPTHMIRLFAQNILNYGDLKEDEAWRALLMDVCEALSSQLGHWETKFDYGMLLEGVPERRLAAVVRFVYGTEAARQGKDLVFVKENHAFAFITFLACSFPEAPYIYLVRDPRDVCLSWKLSPNHPGGVLKGAEVWQADQERFLRAIGYLREQKRIRLVRYEELVSDAETTARELCSFLDVDYSAEMLGFHEKKLTRTNAGRLRDWQNLARPVMADNYGKYHKALSEAEVRAVEVVCGREMELLGYQRDYEEGPDLEELAGTIESGTRKNEKAGEMTAIEKDVRTKRIRNIERVLGRRFPLTLENGEFW